MSLVAAGTIRTPTDVIKALALKAQVHLVRHISRGRIKKPLGKLSDAVLKELDDLLRELLGL